MKLERRDGETLAQYVERCNSLRATQEPREPTLAERVKWLEERMLALEDTWHHPP